MPVKPNFVLCATDMAYGVNWVYERGRMGDYQAGYIRPPAPDFPLGRAVAASACFPPVFNPLPAKVAPAELQGGKVVLGPERDACISGLRLTDGGCYDNMGLEPVWKNHRYVLVSDAGGLFTDEADKGLAWRIPRYQGIQERQTRALRKRWLISNFERNDGQELDGSYWAVGGGRASYELPGGYSENLAKSVIAEIRTDLDDKSSRPGTHALVIGIGRYPWLVGGKSKPRFAQNDGMSQLTSPPASARAYAAWLLDSFDNPNAPLASLDLLLSDEEQKFEGSGRAVEIEPATFENVSSSIKAWAERSTREEDLLLFFFSGHGISAALQTTLLCENYGSDTLAPLSHAIDFTKLHIGLDRVAARRQCFFVDACRVATTNVLDTFDFYGQPVVDPTSQHNPRPRQAPVFYSTLSGQLAYGRKGKPSYFTEALLRGLRGPGSDDNLENDSSWWVRADALLRALPALLHRVAKPGEILQQTPGSDITDLPLHRLKARPAAIPVDVSCAPEARTGKAVLSWSGEGKNQERKKPSPEPWRVDLDEGRYTFKARVSTPKKEGELANESIRPPFRKIRIGL